MKPACFYTAILEPEVFVGRFLIAVYNLNCYITIYLLYLVVHNFYMNIYFLDIFKCIRIKLKPFSFFSYSAFNVQSSNVAFFSFHAIEYLCSFSLLKQSYCQFY